MIEIRHLHYIITTADLGSFSRAAMALRIKQSTLSQRVRHLEDALGIDLFNRSTRGAQLTRAGAQFLSGARQLVADLDSLHHNITTYGKGLRGVLSLGLSGAVPQKATQALFLDFSQQYSDIQLTASVYDRRYLAGELARDRLDAVIIAGHLAPPGAAYHALGSERLFAVMRRDTPLSERAPLYWSDLRGLTLLLPDGDIGDDLLGQIVGRLPQLEDGPDLIRRPLRLDGLYQLMDSNTFMIVDESMLGSPPESLIAIPIHDFHGHARIDYGLCWQASNDNPALAQFLKIMMV